MKCPDGGTCPHVFTEAEAWPTRYAGDDLPPETLTAGEVCGLVPEVIEVPQMTTYERGTMAPGKFEPHPAGAFAKCARGHYWSVETRAEVGGLPDDIEVILEPRR